MERVFWVKNGELEEVNHWLQKGGKIKLIQPVSETIAAYGYHAFDRSNTTLKDHEEAHGYYVGDVFAYIVVEFN